MKVAVRVDASRTIGTGHARRMVALGDAMVRVGADVCFLYRDLDIAVASFLSGDMAAFAPLPAPVRSFAPAGTDPPHARWAEVPQQQDAVETINAVRAFAPDWIIVDHYSLDAQWHEAVAKGTGARLLVIDDLADRPIAADLIVDHNFHPDPDAKYRAANVNGCPLLSGPSYALIGSTYADAPRYMFREDMKSVGIFMGGVDAINATDMALDAMAGAGINMLVEIVTTSANAQLPALRERAASNPALTISVDLPDLAAFYARHDLQIGAGGGALWERFCIGAPTLAVICADNQRASIPFLSDLGVVRMADATGQRAPAVAGIQSVLRELAGDPGERRRIAEGGRKLVDGRGTERIAALLREGIVQ